jgi:two-component system, LytTR family, response regulator
MNITAIIADDEPLGRDLVRHMLSAHPDVHVVAECADGEKALAAIRRHAPRVAFLDIRMPRLDGLSLLQRLAPDARPLIVFITAHETYAIKAFDAHAFDYLLKPFDQERFDQTVLRVRNRLQQIDEARIGQNVRDLLGSTTPLPPATKAAFERIVVRESGRVYFVSVPDIEWIEASGNYVALHVAGGKAHLVHETITAMAAKLDPARFVRIHRSTIVRVDRIKELQPHFNGEFVVILKDNVRLKLSRGFLESARTALGFP